MGKLVLSLLISIVILTIAASIGWIGFDSQLPTIVMSAFWNQVLWLGIIAAIFTAVSYVCGILYSLVIVFTAGLGCILLPLYLVGVGYLQLIAVSYIIPAFTHTVIWWQVLLLSLFVGLSASTYTTSNSKSSN